VVGEPLKQREGLIDDHNKGVSGFAGEGKGRRRGESMELGGPILNNE
jgi:hypothetical protein